MHGNRKEREHSTVTENNNIAGPSIELFAESFEYFSSVATKLDAQELCDREVFTKDHSHSREDISGPSSKESSEAIASTSTSEQFPVHLFNT